MRILQRYMLWEMTVNFVGVTLIAFALLLVNQVGSVLARAAQLQYQKGFVLELIGLSAAQNVAILLPFGLVIGIVTLVSREPGLACSRMYRSPPVVDVIRSRASMSAFGVEAGAGRFTYASGKFRVPGSWVCTPASPGACPLTPPWQPAMSKAGRSRAASFREP